MLGIQNLLAPLSYSLGIYCYKIGLHGICGTLWLYSSNISLNRIKEDHRTRKPLEILCRNKISRLHKHKESPDY